MKPLSTLIALLTILSSVSTLPTTYSSHSPSVSTLTNVTIFTPPDNYTDPRVLYARSVELSNGDLLATWENYSPEPPLVYFPIYRSCDGGATWTEISQIQDQVNNWGLRYQPFLYLLNQSLGGYDAGTVLAAGNSIPTNLSNTQIDLYASTDSGLTWEFVSHVAAGGEALPDNGLTPVWEPFLLVFQDQLVCFYSDQRDPAHGQKLTHQTSTDLKTWTDPVDDVAYANYTARPGMTTVTLLPNASYMMTYEYGGGPGFGDNYSFPVYYRIADSPLEFNNATGYPVIAPDSAQPTSSPYITWSSVGGENGTIVVSCGTLTQVFVNQQLGEQNSWTSVETPEGVSYTRHLRVLQEDPSALLILGAGHLPPAGNDNSVTVSVIDLAAALAA